MIHFFRFFLDLYLEKSEKSLKKNRQIEPFRDCHSFVRMRGGGKNAENCQIKLQMIHFFRCFVFSYFPRLIWKNIGSIFPKSLLIKLLRDGLFDKLFSIFQIYALEKTKNENTGSSEAGGGEMQNLVKSTKSGQIEFQNKDFSFFRFSELGWGEWVRR